MTRGNKSPQSWVGARGRWAAKVRFEEKFTATPESPASVRRFVRRHAPRDVDLDLVVLLATELATNALIHVGMPFEVVIEVEDREVTVGVLDADPTLPHVTHRDDHALGGRGLMMVDVGSESWGAEPSLEGKRVWFAVGRAAR